MDWSKPSTPVTAGAVLLIAWVFLSVGEFNHAATAGWDVKVTGRVTEFDHRAHASRGWYQVRFEYELPDGRTGYGVYRPGGVRTSAVEVLELRDDYTVGSRVRAWANPSDPTEAVIERSQGEGLPIWVFAFPAIGGPLLVWGIAWGGMHRMQARALRRAQQERSVRR